MFALDQVNVLYIREKGYLSILLQPIKVEHLYGIAADVKVNKKNTKLIEIKY